MQSEHEAAKAQGKAEATGATSAVIYQTTTRGILDFVPLLVFGLMAYGCTLWRRFQTQSREVCAGEDGGSDARQAGKTSGKDAHFSTTGSDGETIDL